YKGFGECLATPEALLWFFCQGFKHDRFNRKGKLWTQSVEWWRISIYMMLPDFPYIAVKREISAEPLVDHDRKCVLIAGITGFALQLLRSDIQWCPCWILCAQFF